MLQTVRVHNPYGYPMKSDEQIRREYLRKIHLANLRRTAKKNRIKKNLFGKSELIGTHMKFRPFRSSPDYDTGYDETYEEKRRKRRAKAVKSKKPNKTGRVKKVKKIIKKKAKAKHNPHLALIGVNPMRARKKRCNPPRDAKGRYLPRKVKRSSRKRSSIRRKKNVARIVAKPKKRYRRTPVKKHIRRAVNMRKHRRSRKHAVVANPRRRRRIHARRRNPGGAGFKSLFNPANMKEIGIVLVGAFIGDKVAGVLPNMVLGQYAEGTVGTVGKVAVGLLGSGVLWGVNHDLALGFAVGALNSVANQVLNKALSTAGLAGFETRNWLTDQWVAGSLPVSTAAAAAPTKGLSALPF